ncbi:MAG: hypothetical protein IM609_09765, partial [Phenylobacterium sp.]|nr:hypothetical protein [Phenylobacterium sp.]
DGRIGALRGALESAGHQDVIIMSYAAGLSSGPEPSFPEPMASR